LEYFAGFTTHKEPKIIHTSNYPISGSGKQRRSTVRNHIRSQLKNVHQLLYINIRMCIAPRQCASDMHSKIQSCFYFNFNSFIGINWEYCLISPCKIYNVLKSTVFPAWNTSVSKYRSYTTTLQQLILDIISILSIF
jgi:hypothetical protein